MGELPLVAALTSPPSRGAGGRELVSWRLLNQYGWRRCPGWRDTRAGVRPALVVLLVFDSRSLKLDTGLTHKG
jgi:hypothetical protein